MRKAIVVTTVALAGAALFLAPASGRADRWDVRQEAAEGNREIRRERREAVREIANADSPWEARQEIREAHREVHGLVAVDRGRRHGQLRCLHLHRSRWRRPVVRVELR